MVFIQEECLLFFIFLLFSYSENIVNSSEGEEKSLKKREHIHINNFHQVTIIILLLKIQKKIKNK